MNGIDAWLNENMYDWNEVFCTSTSNETSYTPLKKYMNYEKTMSTMKRILKCYVYEKVCSTFNSINIRFNKSMYIRMRNK